jgi:hypothetical protein
LEKPPNLEKPWNLQMVGYLVLWFRMYWYIYFDVCRDEETSARADRWLRRFGTLRLMRYWFGLTLDGHVMCESRRGIGLLQQYLPCKFLPSFKFGTNEGSALSSWNQSLQLWRNIKR